LPRYTLRHRQFFSLAEANAALAEKIMAPA
jgi:hypothetical protein